MTQSALMAAPAAPEVDTLQKMIADLAADRHRLLRTPPQDVAGVVKELRDTFVEYFTDVALEMQRQRDWTLSALEEVEDEFDEIKAGTGTQLMPEDAEKFKALAQGVDFLIAHVTGAATTLPPEVATELGKLKALAAECLEIIEESTIEIEDEEEGEEAEPGEESTEVTGT